MSDGVRLSRVAATLLAATGLAVGCAAPIDGRPVATFAPPTEPSAAPPLPTPSPPTPTVAPPGIPQELDPVAQGYVLIQTASPSMRCQITQAAVGCEAPFANAPLIAGVRADGVTVTADGTLQWLIGNLSGIPAVTVDFRRYLAMGWTIEATEAGIRFINHRTRHGMFVSIQRVEAF
ncbi:MAG TPA: hypothetical protein VHI10_11160 [Mycobacterium sp.]|nr:hypothetical protein [Mycobacterium sp.]